MTGKLRTARDYLFTHCLSCWQSFFIPKGDCQFLGWPLMLLGLQPHLFLFLRSSRDGNVKWVTLFILHLEKGMKMTNLFHFNINTAFSLLFFTRTKWKTYSIKNLLSNLIHWFQVNPLIFCSCSKWASMAPTVFILANAAC